MFFLSLQTFLIDFGKLKWVFEGVCVCVSMREFWFAFALRKKEPK